LGFHVSTKAAMTEWRARPQPVCESRWAFPPATRWPEHDIIAVGGDLRPETLIAAYRCGLFPMNVPDTDLLGWWSPDPRGVLPLDRLRVTRSMRQSAKRYEVRVDTCFVDVVRGCADPARDDAWITEEFVDAYTNLHHLGWAHSIEVFARDGRLAGGLYGVRVNGLFAGESMFYAQRDASKVALMALVELMRDSGMTLLDVQWATEHLTSLGVIEVSRVEYLPLLQRALDTATPEGAAASGKVGSPCES
jgi:leucyl/phenylalanyl-tRNA---protein transferase